MDTEDRIADLEIRLTFQDDLINQLNDVIVRHEQQIDRLERDLKRALTQLREALPQAGSGDDGPPPHY